MLIKLMTFMPRLKKYWKFEQEYYELQFLKSNKET
jgi:hypothetical protein